MVKIDKNGITMIHQEKQIVSDHALAMKFALAVTENIEKKGIQIESTYVRKLYSKGRTFNLKNWMMEVKTGNNITASCVLNFRLSTDSVAESLYEKITGDDDSMCYSSMEQEERSRAYFVATKANGRANRTLKEERLTDDNNGIFIDQLEYDSKINEWVVTIVHQYTNALKEFRYVIGESIDDLANKMIVDWKKEKGVM